MEKKVGYSTITYKLRLYTNHTEKIKLTRDLYNETILTYYNLLLDNQEFLNLSNQYALRELEKLTIMSRDGKKPKEYIDKDLPVYFRRAAINQAIGAVRSYVSRLNNHIKDSSIPEPSKTNKFNNSPVFYKGMYKNFTGNSILLKLWNGESWGWYRCTLKGRLPDLSNEKSINGNNVEAIEIGNGNLTQDNNIVEPEILSPTIVLNKNYVMLHVPVKEVVEDVRPVKQRMADANLRVCAVSFSNLDNLAICAILDKQGRFIKAKFVKGGDEYRAKTNQILGNIKKHRQTNSKLGKGDHKTYWKKLNRIDETYAHKVSKEIVEFAKQNEAKVIAIAKIEEDVPTFVQKVGKHSPIYLKRKIVEYVEYKAFKESIVVTTVRQNYTASKCNICRGKVKKNGQEFTCENGHRGNYYLNTAMNIGKMCLKKFGLIINKSN